MWLVLWEIIVPLLLAFAIGLFVGWLIWRWRRTRMTMADWGRAIEEDTGVFDLRTERDDLSNRLVVAQKELASVSARAHEFEVDRNALTGSAATLRSDLESSQSEVNRLEGELGVSTTRVRQLEAELEAARAGAPSPASDLEAAQAAARDAEAAAEAARAEAREAADELAQARTRTSELAAATNLAADRVEELQAQVASLTAERDDTAERERTARDELHSARSEVASIAPLRSDLDGASTKIAALEAEVSAGKARATDLETQLDAATHRATDLQTRLDAAAAEPAPAPVTPISTFGAVDTAPTADDNGTADDNRAADNGTADEIDLRAAEAPAWQTGVTKLGTAAAAHTDDLKVINGIGPKMESILHDFEITSWEQIAAFSPDDVGKVSAAIATFPGRIERDEWVEQAGDLVRRFPDRDDRPTRKTFLNRSQDATSSSGRSEFS